MANSIIELKTLMALSIQNPKTLGLPLPKCSQSIAEQHTGHAEFMSACFSLLLVRFYKHMPSTIGARCQMCKKKMGEGS